MASANSKKVAAKKRAVSESDSEAEDKIVKKKVVAPVGKGKQVAKKVAKNYETDEEELEEETAPPKLKKKVPVAAKVVKKASAKQFIDDEAEEGEETPGDVDEEEEAEEADDVEKSDEEEDQAPVVKKVKKADEQGAGSSKKMEISKAPEVSWKVEERDATIIEDWCTCKYGGNDPNLKWALLKDRFCDIICLKSKRRCRFQTGRRYDLSLFLNEVSNGRIECLGVSCFEGREGWDVRAPSIVEGSPFVSIVFSHKTLSSVVFGANQIVAKFIVRKASRVNFVMVSREGFERGVVDSSLTNFASFV